MAAINSNYNNFNSSMFGTTGTGNAASSNNLLGDYAAIKNGSYKKLLSAYYKKQNAEKSGGTTSSTDTNKAEEKAVTVLAQDAKEMKAAADALRTRGKDNLFKLETKTVTDKETGAVTQTESYNLDKIFNAAESFIKAYNNMVDSAKTVSTTVIDKKMALSANMLKKNEGLLEDVGVTIDKDGKLAVDKEKFLKADISDLKTLFNGQNSIADRLSKRASDLYTTTEKILANNAGTYTKTGSINNNIKTGTLIDELL